MVMVSNLWEDLFRKISDPFSIIPNWITDILDILIFAFILYELIILVRNTRAQQLVVGSIVFLLAYAIASAMNLRVLRFFLGAILQFGLLVLAIIFQPELRRMLEQVGNANSKLPKLFGGAHMDDGLRYHWEKVIAAVCDAAETLATKKTGALIVLERNSNLDDVIRTGATLRSEVNVEILDTIFYEGSALHDGAVIIRDAKIEAAGCILPLSNNLDISKDVGTRHRAALGMSENSDAIVVVVSEETGIISITKNAVLIRRLDRQGLFSLLVSEIVPPKPQQKKKSALSGIFKKNKDAKEANDAKDAKK